MKKTRLYHLSLLLMLPLTSPAQTDDPIVMTVAGKPVTKSEFVYSYNKNNGDDVIDKKTVKEYAELFANYKRKVQAALDAKLDTLTSYNKEFKQYRDMQVLPTLINDDDVEQEAQNIYNRTKENIGPDGLVNVSHILFMIGQNPSDSLKSAKEALADSVYYALKTGADFKTLATEKSDDVGSARHGGELGWIAKGQTLPAFENAVFSMQDGEISKPILSEVGYHIIKVDGHKQFEPYDSLKKDIYNFIEKRRIREALAQARLKAIAASKGETTEQVMDMRSDSLANISQDMKYLIQEYHDGLLLYEISNRDVWEKAAKDEAGLQEFYKKNKANYKWDAPRFKGIAYYTRDEKDIKAVKKSIKGQSFDKWVEILRTTFNNDSVLRIRVEKGIFKQGDNKIVDKNIFKDKNAKIREIKDFPYTDTFGKVIKAPEELGDVRALVTSDYQEMKEQEWVEELKKRYPATINEDVLNTIQ